MENERRANGANPGMDAEFLSRVQIFNGLPGEVLEQLGDYLEEVKPTPGDILFNQGQIGESLYIVVSGSVNILVRNEEGRTIRTATVRRGECFGELAVIDRKPRTATAMAMEDTLLLELSGERFMELMSMNPPMAKNLLLLFCNRVRELEVKLASFEWEANVDKLTGLYNRRWFDAVLDNEFKRSARYMHPLSMLMLDIDHFKQVNDTYGHLAGDYVLQQVSSVIRGGTRTTDSTARCGGEEFAVILPDTQTEDATFVAERIRQQILGHSFLDEGGRKLEPVTISIGVGGSIGLQRPTELVEHVDQALYLAKRSGRNCVKAANGGAPQAGAG